MAKIDVTKIEGYEQMTVEEKLAAALSVEINAPTEEIDKLKATLSKANSEAAGYKKQLKEKMSAEEKLAAEQAESTKALKDRIAELERKELVATYKANFMGMGYSEEDATKSAEAMADGDMSVVFAEQKKNLEKQAARIEEETLKKQPSISNGKTPETEDRQLAEMRRYMGL